MLTNDLQALTLATYIPYARKNDFGYRIKTTHASSRLDPDDRSRIQQYAHSVVLETLAHHLYGQTHWSHIRKYRSYPSGVYSRSSLRNFCNAVTQACQTNTILELFAPDAAREIETSEQEYEHGKKPYLVLAVEEEIKKVVTQMVNTALTFIAPPEFRPVTVCTGADEPVYDDQQDEDAIIWVADASSVPASGRGCGRGRMRGASRGRGGAVWRDRAHSDRYHGSEQHHVVKSLKRDFKRVGMTANDDSDCHYFTCIDFGDEELHPWEEDFEGYNMKLEGL
ncbi:hypothetical protein DOTSEDRAFT_28370 [Dothistroma septosporum NZE10]|uniref:Uncharacterized protein n=1 Tax=Dothistroma septosporum (strain NZE10 / CBS 128990) TaxID=675120 RepID=M2YJX3_DOTSN|nr:hypothetical protein DOTSEDRAFT_28370 [Dothistroma septosporum NZE10]